MKYIRRTASVAAIAAASLALSSCGFGGSGGGGGDADGATTLDMLVPTYSEGTKGLWEGVIADFEAANEDIEINLQVESWDNLESVLNTKIQAGSAPDIYNGGAFSGFASEGLLYPAEEIASAETLADFQESFAANEEVEGTQYGLPLIASARAMFYNTELFEEAGVDAPPTTWDELYDAAEAITEETGKPGYGMPLGSEEAQGEALIWFGGNGGGYGDENTIAVDTPENVEAAEFMQKMIDDGLTQSDPGSTQRTPMLNVFFQGQIGMVYGLPQNVGQIAEEYPDLEYGIAQVATADGSPATLGVADRLMAFQNDGDKAEAITRFMDYFYSQEVYTNWVESEGFLPTTKSGSEALEGDEDLKPFLDMLPDAVFYPTTNPNWSATDGAMKSLFGQIGQGKDPSDVLGEIQQRADRGAN